MLCSEWVPSEWESDKNITIIHSTPVHQLTSGEDKRWNKSVMSAVDYCDVFIRLSFWRHPFTAEHPLLRHWCRDTFLQIWWIRTFSANLNILDELFLQLVDNYFINFQTFLSFFFGQSLCFFNLVFLSVCNKAVCACKLQSTKSLLTALHLFKGKHFPCSPSFES